jgi:nudix-type nucleoside diphosphatase (YffH/AdpP family)
MPEYQKVKVHKQNRILDDFFKVDEMIVSHQKTDGSMSAEQRRLIFERGNSAAVLLFNTESKCVVLVNQFKAPTLGKGRQDGWINETVAGIVERHEKPESTAVREVMEETGYRINRLEPIATFFSSPGGTSEMIYLYYAEVTNADKVAVGGGNPAEGEDIRVEEIPLDDLLQMIEENQVEDPKLLIGGLWLRDEHRDKARRPLNYSSVQYQLAGYPERILGYKTGPISHIKGVDIWVNSENEDMIMDRFVGKTISANIRYLGANKDASGSLIDDIINNDLTALVGSQSPVRIGRVFETTSGMLARTHQVHAIMHVATVRGAENGLGLKADLDDLALCVRNALAAVDQRNGRHAWLKRLPQIRRLFGLTDSRSVLFPMIGSGDGGLSVDQVAPRLFAAATAYYNDNPSTSINEIYLLAFNAVQETVCKRELDRLRGENVLQKN